ncbi:MAG: rhodanese-like domain-containing protein [Proteobacteria bacterium]|nr:rhodanese-like domain-containing protein [Pseudomonadota bacterium]
MSRLLKSCALALAVTSGATAACAENAPAQQQVNQHAWGEIGIQELEALIQSKTPMQLVDARTDKWFDGTLIAGAKRLPADATEETIAKTLPQKAELVVVYCGGAQCPASKNLAQRLVDAGYKNVIDYHGGISEWKANAKPTENISS